MTRKRKFVKSTVVTSKVGGVRVGRRATHVHRTPVDLLRKYCEADAHLAMHQAQNRNELDFKA